MVEKEEPVEYVVMIKEFKSLHKSHFWLDKSNKKKKKLMSGKVIQRTYTDVVKVIETRKQWKGFYSRINPHKRLEILMQSNTYVVGG